MSEAHAWPACPARSSPASPARVHVVDLGPRDAPAVVLIHGLGGLAEEILLPLRAPLLELGLRILAVDRPGYGGTDRLSGARTGPAAQAGWLADLLDARGVRRPLLLAHSFGAAVALCLARDVGDRVRGLLLVNPFCRPTAPAAVPLLRLALAPVVGEPVRRRLAPAIATGLVRWSLASACAPDPVPPAARALPCRTMAQESAVLAMAAELGAFTADMACLPRDRARVQSRILALSGAQDRVIEGEAHGAWLASRFGAEHRVTPGGHMLHHTRTALLVAALREFALD